MEELWWFLESKAYFVSENYVLGIYFFRFLRGFLELFGSLWYYLACGILLSSLISTLWTPESIEKLFQNRSLSLGWILGASALGVLSPLPLYAVIPVIATLAKVGVPSGLLFAFLVASPIINPVLFVLTSGALGLEMALVRALAGFSLGCVAGLVVEFFFRDQLMIKDHVGARQTKKLNRHFLARLFSEVRGFSGFAVKFFLIGIAVASLVRELIPPNILLELVGNHKEAAVLVAAGAGIPLYACGGGAIPVVKALVAIGLEKGPALAFFISGPATKLSTLVTLRVALPGRMFGVYLVTTLLGACLFGWGYNFF